MTERKDAAVLTTRLTSPEFTVFNSWPQGAKFCPEKKLRVKNMWHGWPLAWNTRSSMGFKQCIYFYLGIIPLKKQKQWKNPGSQKSWNASYRLDIGNLSRWLTQGTVDFLNNQHSWREAFVLEFYLFEKSKGQRRLWNGVPEIYCCF